MPRSLWKGTVSFGLVNIPVQLFSAVRDRSIRFHRMTPDGSCRLRTKLFCPETNEEYDFDQTGRGYEVAPGQYVLIDDAELAALLPEAGHTIEIEDFVSSDEIDPVYYDRPYYLGPAEGGVRAYALLAEAMSRVGKVGIARFVLREKEHLAALRVSQGGLCLSTMNYADEVTALRDVAAPPSQPADEKQVALATDLIAALTRPFDPTRYRDRHRDEVVQLLEAKAAGQRIPTRAEPEPLAEVVDLLDALRESLGQVADRAGDPEKPARNKHTAAS